MWGFTKREQQAISFLLIMFGVGCAILFYRKRLPPPPVSEEQAAIMQAFASQVRDKAPDSTQSRGFVTPVARSARLNLNAATYDELLQLPGIGPVMAKRIVEYRQQQGPFRRLDDLVKVRGIGKKKLEALKALVDVK